MRDTCARATTRAMLRAFDALAPQRAMAPLVVDRRAHHGCASSIFASGRGRSPARVRASSSWTTPTTLFSTRLLSARRALSPSLDAVRRVADATRLARVASAAATRVSRRRLARSARDYYAPDDVRVGHAIAYVKRDRHVLAVVTAPVRRRQVAVVTHDGASDKVELKHVEKVFALTTEDGRRLKTKQMMATRAFATAEVDANARAGGGVARDAWARVVAARAGDGDGDGDGDGASHQLAPISTAELAAFFYPEEGSGSGSDDDASASARLAAVAAKSGAPPSLLRAYATHRVLSEDATMFKAMSKGFYAPRTRVGIEARSDAQTGPRTTASAW